jgi:hypothetical protein
MATITIDGVDYDVYADIETADDYLQADFAATAWRAETDDDQKGRALVTATRLLDRLNWKGDKEDPDQPNAFPRSGMGLSDIDDDEIPQEIIDASIILARDIHSGSKVDSQANNEQTIKRQKAGSVEQEFFRSFVDPTRLPQAVLELVRRFLAGAALPGGAIASGVHGCSAFDPDYSIGQPI